MLSYHSRASSTSGTDSSDADPCCVELFTALFLFFSSSSVVGSRSATSYLATALLSARGLQHLTWRLRYCLLEVCNILPGDCAAVCSRLGFGMFGTLLRVIVWAICAYPLSCWFESCCSVMGRVRVRGRSRERRVCVVCD